VLENLVTMAGYHGIGGARATERAHELLRFANLQEREDAQVRELSGGMRRRLLIARALINEPQIVVLDEPTTGLDPQARQSVWQTLEQLKQRGVTLLLTTHYMEEATRMCDRLVIMDHGTIVAEGSPRELIERFEQPDLEGVFLHITGGSLDA
jgi:lipooligosaccharide transport system ATP-binding protein